MGSDVLSCEGSMTELEVYEELLTELERLRRCHRDAINAEERIFWPMEDLGRAVTNKVENLRQES